MRAGRAFGVSGLAPFPGLALVRRASGAVLPIGVVRLDRIIEANAPGGQAPATGTICQPAAAHAGEPVAPQMHIGAPGKTRGAARAVPGVYPRPGGFCRRARRALCRVGPDPVLTALSGQSPGPCKGAGHCLQRGQHAFDSGPHDPAGCLWDAPWARNRTGQYAKSCTAIPPVHGSYP